MDMDDLLENEDPSTPPEIIGYVTLDEANKYMAENYVSADEVRTSWEGLTDDDKAALLRRSFQSIELLPFIGHKLCPEQKTQFPRCPYTEVPDPVKWAQIEQAATTSNDGENEEAKHYEKLWQWGVNSYTIGNLSETISTGTYGAGALRTAGVSSPVAARLLSPYIQGGFNIR